jgi:Uma2 family endonuclease
MSQAPSVAQPPAGRCLLLRDVDWRTYSRLLHVFAERPGVRLTYDRGVLEIMSPRREHEEDGQVLNLFVFVLTEELGLPFTPGGSTTLRRRLRRRGVEADECYWIANAHRLTGVRGLNLRRDPPPDLVIEVDVTHSSLDRLSIYAALGVPEVWRLDGDQLTFYVLGARGTYSPAAASQALPLVTPADLLGFLQQARQAGDKVPVLRQFREWVRQRRAAADAPPANP